uniref:Uncharacterized protein n=1 Tax=Megaselia scalaris TaxID=36166 RepID=T1GTM0_MEGSC
MDDKMQNTVKCIAAEKNCASLEEYRSKRREASKLCRQRKRRFHRKNMEALEIMRNRNERKCFVPIPSPCNDKSGNLITNKQKILGR